MADSSLGRKLLGWAAVLPIVAVAAIGAGGCFLRDPTRFQPAARSVTGRPVAVYFAGTAGLLPLGDEPDIATALRRQGVPVLRVDTPSLFVGDKDRAYVDQLVDDSIREALSASGAEHVALIGFAFGADILDTGLGAVPPDLRHRVSSVVLIRPDPTVHFHAGPAWLRLHDLPDSDPHRTLRLLRGLSVTCIQADSDNLCASPGLEGMRRVSFAGPRPTFWQKRDLTAAATHAVLYPAGVMQ